LAFGTVVAPGVSAIGSIIGAVVGGFIGSALATKILDLVNSILLQLAPVYCIGKRIQFSEFECGASTEEINSSNARKRLNIFRTKVKTTKIGAHYSITCPSSSCLISIGEF
jgi:hypothetical protein